MNPRPDETWISAFLDGELADAERATVDRLASLDGQSSDRIRELLVSLERTTSLLRSLEKVEPGRALVERIFAAAFDAEADVEFDDDEVARSLAELKVERAPSEVVEQIFASLGAIDLSPDSNVRNEPLEPPVGESATDRSWISAYFDDELTEDESRRVESLLARSADLGDEKRSVKRVRRVLMRSPKVYPDLLMVERMLESASATDGRPSVGATDYSQTNLGARSNEGAHRGARRLFAATALVAIAGCIVVALPMIQRFGANPKQNDLLSASSDAVFPVRKKVVDAADRSNRATSSSNASVEPLDQDLQRRLLDEMERELSAERAGRNATPRHVEHIDVAKLDDVDELDRRIIIIECLDVERVLDRFLGNLIAHDIDILRSRDEAFRGDGGAEEIGFAVSCRTDALKKVIESMIEHESLGGATIARTYLSDRPQSAASTARVDATKTDENKQGARLEQVDQVAAAIPYSVLKRLERVEGAPAQPAERKKEHVEEPARSDAATGDTTKSATNSSETNRLDRSRDRVRVVFVLKRAVEQKTTN